MRKPRSALALLLLLGFSVSFSVPAEDVPETAHDESESLPYEMTPLASIMVNESVQALRSLPGSLPAPRRAATHSAFPAEREELAAHPISSLILNHALRC
jgi:hypothetical protein